MSGGVPRALLDLIPESTQRLVLEIASLDTNELGQKLVSALPGGPDLFVADDSILRKEPHPEGAVLRVLRPNMADRQIVIHSFRGQSP